MVRAVIEDHLHVRDGVARQHSSVHGLPDALLNSIDVLAGNLAAHDLVDEYQNFARLGRGNFDFNMTVLSPAT